MFQRMIDDFKDGARIALQMTSLATAAVLALLVTICFLCAAAFVFVLQNYGLIQACLTCAGMFFVVAVIAAGFYMERKRIKIRSAQATKPAMHNALSDPMLVAAGIQIVRAIGIEKLVPLLAIGGLALGLLAASRRDASDQSSPDE
jgi:hypothetical protein